MDDDGDLHEQILHIEAHIEELADVIERCRKIILISKSAIATGGTLILAMIIGAVGFDPTVMIGAIAAVIGGIGVFGSNTTTLKQGMCESWGRIFRLPKNSEHFRIVQGRAPALVIR